MVHQKTAACNGGERPVIWETGGLRVSIHKQKIISAFADNWPLRLADHTHFAYGMSKFASLIKLPCVAAYNV